MLFRFSRLCAYLSQKLNEIKKFSKKHSLTVITFGFCYVLEYFCTNKNKFTIL